MIKDCKLFKNIEPINWWLDKVRLTEEESDILDDDIDWIHDFNNKEEYRWELDEAEYNLEKEKLFSKMLNSNINSDGWDLLLRKRATQHIEELFEKHVDNETLVITSSFEHFSVENVRDKCKNTIRLDDEDENSNIIYKLDYCISEAKKYKKVFVYVIGTECITGRRRDNNVYKRLHDKFEEENIPFIMVLDAVQEMFIYPRDYSFYDYVIGTVHSTYDKFDQGLLLQKLKPVNYTFYGYKNVDVLKRLNRGLDIILKRHPYILMYNTIMDESLNKDLFYKFNTYKSQPNFYSMYKTGDFLYDDEIIKYVNNMQEKGKNIHSGASIDISYHKPFREMVIGFRAQSLMFDEDEIIERYNNFCNNYKKLCTMIMRANVERL